MSADGEIAALQAAISAQEGSRATLGDAVVDTTVAALRARLEALVAQQHAPPQPAPPVAREQLLEQLLGYLPAELADKMRALGRIEGERKQVTVLFADLSGFTELTERMDPEDVTTLINDALKELAEAVYQHEGYIDKFVGDGVMAVFGAPVAHEDDPERALRAALAMRECLGQLNRHWIDRLGEPLTLHIGVNTGPVVAGNVGSNLRMSYTVMGDTVNTASRLEGAAAPGQILVSRDTYRLTHGAFTFEALEPLRVKGKREPLSVFELQRARLQPVRARGLSGLSSPLIGREAEWEALGGVQAVLASGRGRVVQLTGEAGLGKSRLMAEWRSTLGPGVRWLEGRAFQHTSTLPYGPFLDLFRRYAAISDDDSEAQARARLRTAIDALFPDDPDAPAVIANLLAMRLSDVEAATLATLPADALRRRIFALVEQLFARLARDRPTWLIVEDLHWCDATSIELIEHLLPLTERLPLALAVVSRPDSGETAEGLFALVRSRYAGQLVEIPLAPLSERSSLEMVEELLSTSEPPEPLRVLILTKAEGNPFFVEEVIRDLIERGALMRSSNGAGWAATPLLESVNVPDTLQGLIMSRLDRLPDETKWVIQQAAVIGRVFLYRVLLQLAEGSADLDDDLSLLAREQLIRERTRQPEVEYVFKHALTQDVAYQSLLSPRRKELHRKVGETLESLFRERLGEFSAILGNHFLRGEAWDWAASYLLQAGEAAARFYAHAEARVHLTEALRALDHLDPSPANRRLRAEVTLKLVAVSQVADRPEVNLARLASAEALASDLPTDERHLIARIQLATGRAHYYHNALPQALDSFNRVMAAARDLDDRGLLQQSTAMVGRGYSLQGRFRDAAPLLELASGGFEQAEDWPEWILATGFLGVALAAAGRYQEGRARVERVIARARETHNPTGLGAGVVFLEVVNCLGHDYVSALRSSRETLEVAEPSGDWLYVYLAHGFAGWAFGRLGQLESAHEQFERWRAVHERMGGRLVMSAWFEAARAELELAAGRAAAALDLAGAAVATARAIGDVFGEGLGLRVRGLATAALGAASIEELAGPFVASRDLFERGGGRVEALYTDALWGRVRLQRGDEGGRVQRDAAVQALGALGIGDEVSEALSWRLEPRQVPGRGLPAGG